jgi:hypothetical protein
MKKEFLSKTIICLILFNSCLIENEIEKNQTEVITPVKIIEYNPVGNPLFNDPSLALGLPKGLGLKTGSLDVVSLGSNDQGEGGSIILKFEQTIVNGSGIDFKIMENPFQVTENNYFIETAKVFLSLDGENWFEFPNSINDEYNIEDQTRYSGLAGVQPVYTNETDLDSPPAQDENSGGDFFDLEEMTSPIKETGFKYLKIVDAGSTISDPGNLNAGNNGFDLDAVVGLNYK